MENPRREAYTALDLPQLWLRHWRKASTKTTRVSLCRYCRDRGVFASEEVLLDHMLETHPDQIESKTNTEASEKFKETLETPLLAESNARLSHDGAAIKTHEELALVESEIPKPVHVTLSTSSLQNLGTELKKEDSSRIESSVAWASRSITKRVIGHGQSPSSAVRATYSNDFPRRVIAKGTSQLKDISSSNQQVASLLENESEIVRPSMSEKRLFEPESKSPIVAQRTLASNVKQRPQSSPQHSQHRSGQSSAQVNLPRPVSDDESSLFAASISARNPTNDTPPPETHPISHEQLVAEVKGIYAGLVMIEGKCIQVDAKQGILAREAHVGSEPKLNNEQWQALIALHRTLLHEHHEFFLASQYPSATPAVQRLANKYAMPARLWRHGIHSFLELLRNRLPDSLHHMLAFVYLAYSMMTLLYKTVPSFEETWIECLGDLGRYRLAIEDDDVQDEKVWTQVARQWYLKASDRSPKTARLNHHLAILAQPNAQQQLIFYYKALSIPQPFVAPRESVLTLFQPITEGNEARRPPFMINAHTKLYAILFAQNPHTQNLSAITRRLDKRIKCITQLAISNLLKPLSSSVTSTARYVKSLIRILTDLKASLLFLIYMRFIKSVTALPTGPQSKTYDEDTSDAFMLFLEAKLKQFTDEMAGPLLLNLCSAIVLIGTHILIVQFDRGLCKDWDLLLIAMNTTSLGLIFLAIDESYSGWQLAILWGFTASFIITYLKGRLINLKLSGINAVSIVTLGIVADTVLATYATFPGRLAEPWILGSIAVLPCISFFTCVWVAFLHQTGLVHAIEDESRMNSVLDFLGGIWTAIMIWHGIRPHRHSE